MLSRENLKSFLDPKDKVPKYLLCIILMRIYDFGLTIFILSEGKKSMDPKSNLFRKEGVSERHY